MPKRTGRVIFTSESVIASSVGFSEMISAMTNIDRHVNTSFGPESCRIRTTAAMYLKDTHWTPEVASKRVWHVQIITRLQNSVDWGSMWTPYLSEESEGTQVCAVQNCTSPIPASLPEAFYAPLSPFYTRPVDDCNPNKRWKSTLQLHIREFPREHPHKEEKAICVTVQKRTAKSYGRERWAWRSCSSFLALLLEATTHCISDDSSRFFHALTIWKECNSFVVDSNSAIPQL